MSSVRRVSRSAGRFGAVCGGCVLQGGCGAGILSGSCGAGSGETGLTIAASIASRAPCHQNRPFASPQSMPRELLDLEHTMLMSAIR